MTTESSIQNGELAAKISNAVVRALSRTTGRGPTKAKTTLGANGVFVVLQDTLTRGEQTLADAGNHEFVLDLRRRWQRVMKKDVSREIEELTGRKVIGFMSDNHIDPDLAVEVFVLEPLSKRGRSLTLQPATQAPRSVRPRVLFRATSSTDDRRSGRAGECCSPMTEQASEWSPTRWLLLRRSTHPPRSSADTVPLPAEQHSVRRPRREESVVAASTHGGQCGSVRRRS